MACGVLGDKLQPATVLTFCQLGPKRTYFKAILFKIERLFSKEILNISSQNGGPANAYV